MDGFTGSKTATTKELSDAITVIDPFHVVRLAGEALDQCRRRVQQQHCDHRGRSGDPPYLARRTLHTGADLVTETTSRPPASTRCARRMGTSRSSVGVRPHVSVRVRPHVLVFGLGIMAWGRLRGAARGGL